jgi:hypothetical protein
LRSLKPPLRHHVRQAACISTTIAAVGSYRPHNKNVPAPRLQYSATSSPLIWSCSMEQSLPCMGRLFVQTQILSFAYRPNQEIASPFRLHFVGLTTRVVHWGFMGSYRSAHAAPAVTTDPRGRWALMLSAQTQQHRISLFQRMGQWARSAGMAAASARGALRRPGAGPRAFGLRGNSRAVRSPRAG